MKVSFSLFFVGAACEGATAAYIRLCFGHPLLSRESASAPPVRIGLGTTEQELVDVPSCIPIGKRPAAMEAEKPSGPIATDSPASSIANNPAGSSYPPPTIAATTTTLPPPPHPPVLHNAHPTVMDLDTSTAEDRSRRATSVISMDDLEAAQALEGLRSGMFTCLHSASAEKR